jgi:predicted membrane channel-forming protein YqfA (hemolysin III family)
VILSPGLLKNLANNWIVAATCIVAGYSCSPGFLHLWLFMDSKYLPVVPVWTFVIAGLCMVMGATFYATKVPERWFTKKFDIIGNSHNIFHCMGIMAALLAFKGSIRMYHERQLY